jgi:serine/threonine protein kinase
MSPASDIFAWGAVVTFAGTGRTPFAADSAPATAMRILTQPPTLTGLPAPLRGIVARTLAKDPAERPTARELLDLLLATDPPASAAPTRPKPPGAVSPHPAQPAPINPDTPMQCSGEEAGRPHHRLLKRASVTVVTLAILLLAGLVGYSLLPGSGADLGRRHPSVRPNSATRCSRLTCAEPATQVPRVGAPRQPSGASLATDLGRSSTTSKGSPLASIEMERTSGLRSQGRIVFSPTTCLRDPSHLMLGWPRR